MPLGPDDLVLCAGTLATAGLRERAEAAAAAGFTGISLFASDMERARAEGLSDADVRALLGDLGLAVAELDPLLAWLPGAERAPGLTEEGRLFLRYREADFYALADTLGARSLNVVALAEPPLPFEAIAEAFAALCDRAASHGLLVHLEWLPWTPVGDLGAAAEIVRLADRPNGGIMLDAWQHFRAGGDAASLRVLPAGRVLAVQLCDAPATPEADPIAETLRRRLLPGEGDIDLVAILRWLREVGSTAPIGVEVFSEKLAALPAREAARRAAEAARRVLAQAAAEG